MTWNIEFVPFAPWPVLTALAALGVLLAGALFWRRARGALLRTLSYALLLLALANPHLKQEDREPLKDIVAVVIDDSQSQRVTGRTPRIAEIEKQLAARLGDLSNVEVRWIRSSGPGSEGEREGTALFGDLTRALANVPLDRLAGVMFVTDGQVHDAPNGAAGVGEDAPLHSLIAGKPGEFDRRLEITRAPRFGLVGAKQTIELRVLESGGSGSPSSLTLAIHRDGKEEERRSVRVGEKIELPISIDHAGANIVELEVDADPKELTPVNNRSVLTIEGVRENLRVLLVSGEPHAGERTWRNLLKSDAAVDLVHFTILRPPEKQDGTPINQLSLIAFPTRELFSEKLDQFDLIIFDRYQRRGVLPLLYLDNVARYVEKGGAVLVSAGDDYSSPLSLYRTPLAQILPAVPSGRVVEQPFKPGLTDLGRKHPVTHDLPGAGVNGGEPSWGRWFRLVDVQPDNAEVLMHGPDDKPLLVLGRRGQGRVALLLSDHAWLWARGYEGGGPYTDLLRRSAHWLMKEPDLEEETLRAVPRGSNLVIERRSMKDEVEPVVVTKPSGQEETLTAERVEDGLWRATLSAAEQGVYHLKSGDLTAVANIGAVNPKELAEVVATDAPMKPAVEAAGGGQYWLGREAGTSLDLPRIAMLRRASVMHGADWIGLHKREAYAVKGVRLFPLFSGFLALGLLLGAIALTWFREGR